MIAFDWTNCEHYIWQIVWFIRYWGVMHQIRSFEEIILQRTLIRSFENLISRAVTVLIVLQISHCSQKRLVNMYDVSVMCFCDSVSVFFSGSQGPDMCTCGSLLLCGCLLFGCERIIPGTVWKMTGSVQNPTMLSFFSQKGNWLTSSSKNWRTLWGLLVSCLLFILFSLSEVRAFEFFFTRFQKKINQHKCTKMCHHFSSYNTQYQNIVIWILLCVIL